MTQRTIWWTRLPRPLLIGLSLLLIAACSEQPFTSPEADGGGDDPDPNGTGTVTLSWNPPSTNADGSGPLTDLAGYTIHYGPSNSQLSSSEDVGDVTTTELELPVGTHFFAVRAYDHMRNQSTLSNVIKVTVSAPPSAS